MCLCLTVIFKLFAKFGLNKQNARLTTRIISVTGFFAGPVATRITNSNKAEHHQPWKGLEYGSSLVCSNLPKPLHARPAIDAVATRSAGGLR